MGMGGGITLVYTVFIPDLSHALGAAGLSESVSRSEKSVTRALQKNMNPALNVAIASKNITYRPLALRRADLRDGRTASH